MTLFQYTFTNNHKIITKPLQFFNDPRFPDENNPPPLFRKAGSFYALYGWGGCILKRPSLISRRLDKHEMYNMSHLRNQDIEGEQPAPALH